MAGWSGSFCQSAIDECASVPCQNGATCVDSTNAFSCTCVAGFSGVLCQTNIDECASAPCANGGTCAEAVNGKVVSVDYAVWRDNRLDTGGVWNHP